MVEMEGDIDACVPLDYAAFQILPAQNRYEASVCCGSRIENLAAGLLEQLSLHLPAVKELSLKECADNLRLQLPESLNAAPWFTKSTLSRFLHIVASPDLLSTVKTIEDEISQLEEARKFQLSLYSQGRQDHYGSEDTDGRNLHDKVASPKSEYLNASSDASRNELLRAMDSRLVALKEELEATFNQAAGNTCSVMDFTDVARFSQHFGASRLGNSLCKLLELGKRRQIGDGLNDCDVRNESPNKILGYTQTSKSVGMVKPVKYGVSPAKVAQVERQNSTESDESSYSGDEEQTSAERSRTLVRSATPRRSASPMRRIQIGRTGSRRTPALAIKSLNYFPSRERGNSHRDAIGNNDEDEGLNQPQRKPENNVQRMTVQDAINLFERKQREQGADNQKLKSSTDATTTTNKSVLRRWSTGMGDSSAKGLPEIIPEKLFQATSTTLDDGVVAEESLEASAESSSVSGSRVCVEASAVDGQVEPSEYKSSPPLDTMANTPVDCRENISERLITSAEWNRQKEAELQSMMMQMKESKPVKYKTTVAEGKVNQSVPSVQRGKLYDHNKVKKDKKLQGKNTGKQAEKEFRVTKKIVDQRKSDMALSNVSDTQKEHSTAKPQKSRKNISPSANPRKETLKPAATRKVASKDSATSPRRKSWPSAPLPRTTATSPARNPASGSSASSKVTRQKVQPKKSLPQPVPKAEGLQQREKSFKGTQSQSSKSLKGMNEKKHQTAARGVKTTKPKVLPTSGDYLGMVPADHSFSSKINKKSSVVPLESKPYLRKGSGIGPGVSPANGKVKTSTQPVDSLKSSENLILAEETQTVSETCEPVIQREEGNPVAVETQDADLGSEIQVNGDQNCDGEKSIDQVILDGDNDSYSNVENAPSKDPAESQSVISPSAWVEIEEQSTVPMPCDDSTSQLASPARVAPTELSSLPVRHSLSQMLQEEISEPDFIEWGNSENPPAMIYHKDAPRGLKRLLKFARKSKADANMTGCPSPSTFSEGDEDSEESKANGRRHCDNVPRKVGLHTKNYGQQKALLRKSYDSQSSMDRSSDQSSHKLHASTAAAATKATRSFFSLSAFRGSKQSDPKLH